MPVTFRLARHCAKSANIKGVRSSQIVEQGCPNQFNQADNILQYSVGGRSARPSDRTEFKIIPNENSFVNTVMTAYSRHYALVVRPDDVWLATSAILHFACAFFDIASFVHVNADTELLHANFVAPRDLEVTGDIPLDVGKLSRQLEHLIHKNVVDPGLRDWILPNFSTTTDNDTTVGSMLMMATTKKCFDYKISFLCGIPRVTLDGERRDWELIIQRLEKLKEYGIQIIAWYHLLFPVILRLVQAFDEPNSPDNLDFWGKVVCESVGGSGSRYWSGWITSFCVFSFEGKWQGPRLDTVSLVIQRFFR
ncbi:hypothetical protein B0H19DRAFT_949997 [Mycena capillaripes]|nr:hypothetical protein B0H19DRAFT_949997 [Mycena capillaripes]